MVFQNAEVEINVYLQSFKTKYTKSTHCNIQGGNSKTRYLSGVFLFSPMLKEKLNYIASYDLKFRVCYKRFQILETF